MAIGATTQAMRSMSMFNSRGERISPRRFTEGGRHGSAERESAGGSLRRPRSRERARYVQEPAQPIRTGPAGQEERRSWLDALNDLAEKVNRIDLDTRNNAQAIADVKTKLQDEHNYTRNLRNDLNNQLFENPDSSTKKIGGLDKRIQAIPSAIEAKDAIVQAKMDAIESTLNSLLQEVSRINSGGPRNVQAMATPVSLAGAEAQPIPMSPLQQAEVPVGYGGLGAPAAPGVDIYDSGPNGTKR